MRAPVALSLTAASLVIAVPTLAAAVRAKSRSQQPPAAAKPARYCTGEYADELSSLSPAARSFDQAQPPYTYCIRTSAVYECPSYAPDGSLRRSLRNVVAHGTGFGYRQVNGETLLVTNDHVAEWPAVTDEEHPVEDVPAGCKRVSDRLRIVENERDAYERDDVALSRVVADPALDVAVLRAKATLPVSPWKIGRSSALRERNAVDVRGFPLGALRANNGGKVISAYEHDSDRDWDHDDFVVDALLSPGNSGSPVFAVSCQTGEFELVGVYHAGYTKGSALNVVVGIDQLRDMLTTLKRSPRAHDVATALAAADRSKLVEGLRADPVPYFPFGGLSAMARARPDGGLVFAVMPKEFPLQTQPALVVEDLPADDGGFGQLGRLWAGNRQGLREVDHAALDADGQAQLAKLLEALRRDALLVTSYRSVTRQGMASRERFQAITKLERSVRRVSATRQDLAQGALELSERLCPTTADASLSLAAALDAHPAQPSRGLAASLGAAGDWRPVLTGEAPSTPPLPPLAVAPSS